MINRKGITLHVVDEGAASKRILLAKKTLTEMVFEICAPGYWPPATLACKIYMDCTKIWSTAQVSGNDEAAYRETRCRFDVGVASMGEHYIHIANIFAEHKKEDYQF